MFVNSDFSDLLSLFNAKRVEYLVIGGYAVVQHAEPRFTNDLDLWIGTDAANADAVYSALRGFGAPLSGLTADDFKEEGWFYQMGVPPSSLSDFGRRKLAECRQGDRTAWAGAGSVAERQRFLWR